jgi:hypothetical protein
VNQSTCIWLLLLLLLLLPLLLLLQVAELMAAELRWSGHKKRSDMRAANAYLATFATPPAPAPVPAAAQPAAA